MLTSIISLEVYTHLCSQNSATTKQDQILNEVEMNSSKWQDTLFSTTGEIFRNAQNGFLGRKTSYI
jgi:hypothetical protein